MIIYKVKNKINGKIYIGQTVQKLEKRIHSHLNESKNDKNKRPFLHAIKKYGSQNFIWEIIDEALTFEELDEKEIYWIDKYNSLVPNGYNVLGGGQKKIITSQEFSKRISEGLKKSEKWQKTLNSNEYKEKIKNNFNNKGKKFTEEHKNKIRQKNSSRLVEQNKNKSKSWILVDEKNKILRIKNLQDFCQQNNLQTHFFVNILRNHTKNVKRNNGYYCFLDLGQLDDEILTKCQEYDNLNFDSVILLYDKNKKLTLKILKNDLPKFCRENNLDRSNISKVIRGKSKSYKGIELITRRGSSNSVHGT